MSILTTLVVKLTGDISQFQSAMGEAQSMASSFGNSVQSGVNKSLGIAAVGLGSVAAGLGFAAYEGLSFNNSMEQVRAKLSAFLPDAAAVESTLGMIQERAAKTPFEFNAMANAAAALIPSAKQAGVSLETLLETAEVLAASNPAEGLEGAAFALKEAVSGDFTSIIERFNLPRARLKELKEQGVPDLEAVKIAMLELGLSTELVTNLANTAEGRWSTLYDTFVNLAGKLTEPFFQKFSDGLGALGDIITANQPLIDAFVNEQVTKIAAGVESAANFLIKAGGGLKSFISALRSGQGVFTAFTAFIIAAFEPEKALEYIGILNKQIIPFINDNLMPLVEWLQQNVFAFTEWQDILLATAVIFGAVVIPAVLSALAPFAALGLAIVALGVLIGTLKTAWEENWGGIRDIVAQAQAMITPFFTDFNGQMLLLMQRIEPLLPRITAFVGAVLLIGGLYGTIAVITSITAAVGGLWGLLMSAGGILGVLGSIVAFLGGPVTLAIAAIIAISALFYVAWTENWWGIQETVAQFVVDFWQGVDLVGQGLTSLWNMTKTTASKMMEAFTNGDWASIGWTIINGLTGGMGSAMGIAIEAAMKVAQAIWDTITGYFSGASSKSVGEGKDGGGAGKGNTGAGGGNKAKGQSTPAGDTMAGMSSVQNVGGFNNRGSQSGGQPVNIYIQAPIYGVNQLEETIRRVVNDSAKQAANRGRV